MSVSKLHQQSSERLELLAPLLAPAEADRCEAMGEELIESGIPHECSSEHLDDSINSTAFGLLRSLRQSLIERGGILATLPRDRFASRQLGLDLVTYQALRGRPTVDPELLQLVLHRFESRACYWTEVEQVLLQSLGRKPTIG